MLPLLARSIAPCIAVCFVSKVAVVSIRGSATMRCMNLRLTLSTHVQHGGVTVNPPSNSFDWHIHVKYMVLVLSEFAHI